MVNLVNKDWKPYKTKPRFSERAVTNHGLCIWQLNKMLRGTGYKIEREWQCNSVVELLLVPTGYKKVPLIDPFTGNWYVRLFPREKTLEKWQKTINNLMTRPVTKEWIINIWKKKNQKYYRTYNNKPDWKNIEGAANQLWRIHYGKKIPS
tara:strand:+ start:190 stop:639 length:450 start_codon:yes stop_codon:yes gene_type:complete